MAQDVCTRRTVVGLAGTAIAVGLAGCADGDGGNNTGGDGTPAGNETDGGTPTNGGGPMLRFAHMAPSAPEVDISVGGQTVVEGLAYTDVTQYQTVENGSVQVTVTPAGGDGEPVFDEQIEVGQGPQTAVALGELPMGGAGGNATGNQTGNATGGNATGNETDNGTGNGTGNQTGTGAGPTGTEFTVEVFNDDLELPGEDTAKIRLVHAAPDAPAVTVSTTEMTPTPGGDTGNETNATDGNAMAGNATTGNATAGNETGGGTPGEMPGAVFQNVGFGEASEYAELPAGTVTLEIAAAADGGTAGGNATSNTTASPADGNATGTNETGTNETGTGMGTGSGTVGTTQLTLDGETVYTLFATGYLMPEAAPVNEDFQLVLAVDASPEMGGGAGAGNETGGDNATGNETGDTEA